MNTLIILLRLLHIVAGILWAGGAFYYYRFLEPTAKATAPDSQKFMDYLMMQKRFGNFVNLMSLLTILAGGALYYRLASVNVGWIATGPGIGFTIGALAGIIAVAAWNVLIPPRVAKLGNIAQAIRAGGGLASPQQSANLIQIEKEIAAAGKLDFVLTAIAVLTMATARYWNF
jgi:uncharacterized membrane protein